MVSESGAGVPRPARVDAGAVPGEPAGLRYWWEGVKLRRWEYLLRGLIVLAVIIAVVALDASPWVGLVAVVIGALAETAVMLWRRRRRKTLAPGSSPS
ncbi:hypothetical protein LQF12_00825 [Ruania suaedae]|uniref:hypothetical protein n=1 Tax=Ruania suaedae TaxID=2897774 RepID=UPI001E4A1798|nr:hypothetical protein [Ruania suaedae]UFU03189.1 hypothetical protein LQF12_00825 [Ruania suaedae]